MPSQPIDAVQHADKRRNLPTADAHDFVSEQVTAPRILDVERNTALDPQLVWRGKDQQEGHLRVQAPPIYIQEKIEPRALIADLQRTSGPQDDAGTLFDNFDGLDDYQSVEFYQHQAHWSNRMILGDSLEVMASLVEREDLRGQVQCVYMDPPYGIKFQSNWQGQTGKRDVKDRLSDVTREVEQIKAFRDTWEKGTHSYLSYLRNRFLLTHQLLKSSGSIFVQIGDENAHLVRSLLDEVFGRENNVAEINYITTSGRASAALDQVTDRILWFCKDRAALKYRNLWRRRADRTLTEQYTMVETPDGRLRRTTAEERTGARSVPPGSIRFMPDNMSSSGASDEGSQDFELDGRMYGLPPNTHWKTNRAGLERLAQAKRLVPVGRRLRYKRCVGDFPYGPYTNYWDDTVISGYNDAKLYVVQTLPRVIERCLLMATDPGDLVLDPTCGSGTTAFVAEQWGRRWITIDTSRVALALARQRLMAAKLPFYYLADSTEGRLEESQMSGTPSRSGAAQLDVRKGFVYERIPHITLKSIANNPDIREGMSREQVDAAIARNAEVETLYDRPIEDKSRVRVAGRFTVESLSPHRTISFDEAVRSADQRRSEGALVAAVSGPPGYEKSILDNLLAAGVQNGRTSERLLFDDMELYPGNIVQAMGARADAEVGTPERIAIAIGPEYGTVSPQFVKAAAREAIKGVGVDLLLVLGFSFDAQALDVVGEFKASDSSDFASVIEEKRWGKLPISLVRMNADLAMGDELLKKTGAGNLFTIFGEPDIVLEQVGHEYVVEIKGVDLYDPTTGQTRSSEPDSIALWMIDTDYNDESFFVRHAYFCGADDPYKRLKVALKADIDEEAWASVNSTRSRPFARPSTGRIAVKAINDYGDEVMVVREV